MDGFNGSLYITTCISKSPTCVALPFLWCLSSSKGFTSFSIDEHASWGPKWSVTTHQLTIKFLGTISDLLSWRQRSTISQQKIWQEKKNLFFPTKSEIILNIFCLFCFQKLRKKVFFPHSFPANFKYIFPHHVFSLPVVCSWQVLILRTVNGRKPPHPVHSKERVLTVSFFLLFNNTR